MAYIWLQRTQEHKTQLKIYQSLISVTTPTGHNRSAYTLFLQKTKQHQTTFYLLVTVHCSFTWKAFVTLSNALLYIMKHTPQMVLAQCNPPSQFLSINMFVHCRNLLSFSKKSGREQNVPLLPHDGLAEQHSTFLTQSLNLFPPFFQQLPQIKT